MITKRNDGYGGPGSNQYGAKPRVSGTGMYSVDRMNSIKSLGVPGLSRGSSDHSDSEVEAYLSEFDSNPDSKELPEHVSRLMQRYPSSYVSGLTSPNEELRGRFRNDALGSPMTASELADLLEESYPSEPDDTSLDRGLRRPRSRIEACAVVTGRRTEPLGPLYEEVEESRSQMNRDAIRSFGF